MSHDDLTSCPGERPAEGGSAVGRALADRAPTRIGWFRYFFDEDRWEWSPEVQQMHGYEPGTVIPTTKLVLSHKHPDDYREVADTLQLIRQTRQAFRSRHRIVDVPGKVHHIAVLGDEIHDAHGRVIGTHGFYVDLTCEEQARQDQMTAEVAHISERRSGIEHAKGMLMMVYSVDDAAAFELLKWRSQETNVKLARLAEQIVRDFVGVQHNGEMSRYTYDHLFLTAHNRAAEGSRRQGKDMLMTHPDSGHEPEPDPQLQLAEQALRASQRAERARRDAQAAQQSAASSLDESAESHERTAKTYEQTAQYSDPRGEEYREHAARHREFAQEDRRMAQQLRQMAESDSTGSSHRRE